MDKHGDKHDDFKTAASFPLLLIFLYILIWLATQLIYHLNLSFFILGKNHGVLFASQGTKIEILCWKLYAFLGLFWYKWFLLYSSQKFSAAVKLFWTETAGFQITTTKFDFRLFFGPQDQKKLCLQIQLVFGQDTVSIFIKMAEKNWHHTGIPGSFTSEHFGA